MVLLVVVNGTWPSCGKNAVHKQQQEMRKCNNIYEKHSAAGYGGRSDGEMVECKRKLRPKKMWNVCEKHIEWNGREWEYKFHPGNCHCLRSQKLQKLHMFPSSDHSPFVGPNNGASSLPLNSSSKTKFCSILCQHIDRLSCTLVTRPLNECQPFSFLMKPHI